MNSIILVGRLTKDPEIKYIGEKGIPVANFILAVDRKIKNGSKYQKTDFIKIEAWKESVEICINKLKKGSLISLTGELRIDEYKDKEGKNKYITKVITYNINLLKQGKNQFNGIDIFKNDDKVALNESALPF